MRPLSLLTESGNESCVLFVTAISSNAKLSVSGILCENLGECFHDISQPFLPYLFFDHMFSLQLCQQNQKLYDSVDIDTLGGQDLVSHRKIDPCQSELNRCLLMLRFSEFPLLEVTLSKSNKYYEN